MPSRSRSVTQETAYPESSHAHSSQQSQITSSGRPSAVGLRIAGLQPHPPGLWETTVDQTGPEKTADGARSSSAAIAMQRGPASGVPASGAPASGEPESDARPASTGSAGCPASESAGAVPESAGGPPNADRSWSAKHPTKTNVATDRPAPLCASLRQEIAMVDAVSNHRAQTARCGILVGRTGERSFRSCLRWLPRRWLQNSLDARTSPMPS